MRRTGQLTDDLIDLELHASPVERLPPEHAAEGAVVLPADGVHDLVHGSAVELLVGEDRQRQPVLVPVPLDRLETVVPVAGDALVDGDEHQVQAVVEALVQRLHHVGEDRGIFAARGTDADLE